MALYLLYRIPLKGIQGFRSPDNEVGSGSSADAGGPPSASVASGSMAWASARQARVTCKECVLFGFSPDMVAASIQADVYGRRCRLMLGTQKGTIILTTTHIIQYTKLHYSMIFSTTPVFFVLYYTIPSFFGCVLFVGFLRTRALLFGVYIRVLDFWKLPCLSESSLYWRSKCFWVCMMAL